MRHRGSVQELVGQRTTVTVIGYASMPYACDGKMVEEEVGREVKEMIIDMRMIVREVACSDQWAYIDQYKVLSIAAAGVPGSAWRMQWTKEASPLATWEQA